MPERPKKKCCLSRPRCTRCPLRMLAEGRLPEGFTVRKRRLVKDDSAGEGAGKGSKKKHKGKKGKKGKGKKKQKKGGGKGKT